MALKPSWIFPKYSKAIGIGRVPQVRPSVPGPKKVAKPYERLNFVDALKRVCDVWFDSAGDYRLIAVRRARVERPGWLGPGGVMERRGG